jgi:hypothetical protein
MSKRIIWTPDEWLEAAKAAVESAFGDSYNEEKPVAPAQPKPTPVLLPKPVRVPNRAGKGASVTIAQIRKAQVPPSGGSLEIGNLENSTFTD